MNSILKYNTPELWEKYQVEKRRIYVNKSGINDPTYYFIKYLLKERIIKNKDLLEIGFGDGGTLLLISKHFKRIYGADISPGNVKITAKKFVEKEIKNSEFFVLDLCKQINVNKKYSNILLSHVLEHFTEEELEIVLNNVNLLLESGGFLIGATPYNLQLNFRICPNCHTVFETDGHRIVFNEDNLTKIIIKYGFRTILTRKYNFEYQSRNDNYFIKYVRYFYDRQKKRSNQLEFCFQKIKNI